MQRIQIQRTLENFGEEYWQQSCHHRRFRGALEVSWLLVSNINSFHILMINSGVVQVPTSPFSTTDLEGKARGRYRTYSSTESAALIFGETLKSKNEKEKSQRRSLYCSKSKRTKNLRIKLSNYWITWTQLLMISVRAHLHIPTKKPSSKLLRRFIEASSTFHRSFIDVSTKLHRRFIEA